MGTDTVWIGRQQSCDSEQCGSDKEKQAGETATEW